MTQGWEPGVQYNLGDSVDYHGKRYNIIQPHRSQGDWTPDATPALWGMVPYNNCDDDYKQRHHDAAHNQPHKPAHEWHPPPPSPGQQPAQQQPIQAPHQTVDIKDDEKGKSWFDLSDERKKQLEIGGGLAVGIALLGGGFAAYKHHEKSEEEKNAAIWGAQNWLTDAQRRTQEFYRRGPTGPATWILTNGTNIPQGAIKGGEERGETLYIGRAYYEGGIQVGKAARHFGDRGACHIGYGGDEIKLSTYEILVGDMRGIWWHNFGGKFNVGRLNAQPVEGGREADGTPLYIIQAEYNAELHPGKISDKLAHGLFCFGGKERDAASYNVLCYA
ncbi:hypothetical protein AURDEDRAFT_169317 [Auricularia subglabra TFB-10046 SS5]|nr:hypothetical protein AURDEDRAFT_169317 [Auricularia subglabra TFB-10046 SS5]